ncbi:actin-like ATPase domain-containing protein [Ascobolus immersus RN42]|uniref:Actin-like ATPase domain-containing protein n=1 Tax=Ascobolus immersus RN42 TaxID=1160509 RepID=A0A3N4HR57_ASCIM|nr:actin-like ATPase domain-containing protein [Ascobolus immersus RN42]
MSALERHKIVVGVDFGTTYTGIAFVYSIRPEVGDIEVIDTWPGKNGAVDNRNLDKVPTELAYNPDGSPGEWGYQLAPGAARYGCFKLMLDGSLLLTISRRDNQGNYHHEKVSIDSGNSNAVFGVPPNKTAVDISADYLRAIYDHTIEKLKQRLPRMFDITPIQFVLTTPAVWSHKAQQATLDAATIAGFGSRQRDSITMVSEPEAAATYCLQDIHANQGVDVFRVGESIVICDCGGGTVDLITYRVESIRPTLQLTEAVVGDGGKYGSTSIDRQFIAMLRERVGEAIFSKWPAKRTGRGGMIMQAFESAKRGFTLGDKTQKWWIPVGNIPDDPVQQIDDGAMLLDYDDMEFLFENSTQNIEALLKSQITKAGEVSTILLVGGFGQSQFVYKRIQNWAVACFPQMAIRVERPRNSWSAIARGACLHGVGSVVKARKLKQHYGLQMTTAFVEGRHNEADAYYSLWSNEKRVMNNIKWVAAKGESVHEGQRIRIGSSISRHERARENTYTLYSSNDDDASNDTRNPRVYELGTFKCDLRSLPEEAWETKINANGVRVYRASFETIMEIGSAEITFKTYYQDKVCGSAKMAFYSMGEGLREAT